MTAFGAIPSPITVVHIPRHLSDTPDADTGNYEFIEDTPVVRKVQSLGQFGRFGSSHEVMGPDVTERNETRLRMACTNPSLYKPSDLVVINPELDTDGNWITDTGDVYFVDGEPFDERQGPWPALLSVFGGGVKLRRVS